jgi:hypothetical protein
MHKHKIVARKWKTSGWVHCVDADRCAATPRRQEAHGNITNHDVCSCGATRESEINSGRVNYGPWVEQERQ